MVLKINFSKTVINITSSGSLLEISTESPLRQTESELLGTVSKNLYVINSPGDFDP